MANIINSSGYSSVSDFLKDQTSFHHLLLDRHAHTDFIPLVANTNILDPVIKQGDTAVFISSPKVGAWRDYNINQGLVRDQPTADKKCIQICKAVYKSIKLDKLDIRQFGGDYAVFERQFQEDMWVNLSNTFHQDLLTGMLLQTHTRNAGKNAGLYRNYDLGVVGNPVALKPDDLVVYVSTLAQILRDAGRWNDGEMFLVVPEAFKIILTAAMYNKQWCCDTKDSILIKGLIAEDLGGFKVISSNRITPVVDKATNKVTYPILAGWKESYAFAYDIVDARVVDVGDSFGVAYDVLAVYGGGVLYPDGLVKSYVTLSTDGTVKP